MKSKGQPSKNRAKTTSSSGNKEEKETIMVKGCISPSSDTTDNVAGKQNSAIGGEPLPIKTAKDDSQQVTATTTSSPPETLHTSESEGDDIEVDGNLSNSSSSNDAPNTATRSKDNKDMTPGMVQSDNCDSSIHDAGANDKGDTKGHETDASGTGSNGKESNDTDKPSETDPAPHKLLEGIMTALDIVKSDGAICSGGRATSLPAIPGLHVKGVGDISLPLTDFHYKKLFKLRAAQPKKDIVDGGTLTPKARLHIDPEKVSFNNRLWEPVLEELVRKAVKELGVQRNYIKTEFCTLLIQEPDRLLRQCVKTEAAAAKTADGNFATLIVQLPSIFTGGAFVVSQEGVEEKHKFTMGTDTDDAAYSCHYVCHYNDCTHEIQPLESGRRLLLMYSLCYSGDIHNKPSAAQFDYQSLSLLLQKLPTNKSVFLVPMERQYNKAWLNESDALIGADRAKQKAITTAGRGLWTTLIARAPYFIEGCDVFRSDYGYYEDGISVSPEERKFMCQSIDTKLVSQGGMLLGTSKLDEILKIPKACVLIAYSTDFGNSIKLKEIYEDYASLVERTSSGVPVGSWCIPNAQTPNQEITEFLRSQQSGTQRVVIGGGIDNARTLRFLRGEKLIPEFCFTRSAPDHRVVTATAAASSSLMLPGVTITTDQYSGCGNKAAVMVTKIRPMLDRQVEQYQRDMGMLAKMIREIRRLGGQLPSEKPTAVESSLASAKNAATTIQAPAAITRPLAAILNQPSENPEPSKKRHKKAHDPVDAAPKVQLKARNSLATLEPIDTELNEHQTLRGYVGYDLNSSNGTEVSML